MGQLPVDHIETKDVDIGFFDICVGDIPYHQDIEGWFELRFQESLLLGRKRTFFCFRQVPQNVKSKRICIMLYGLLVRNQIYSINNMTPP